MDSALWKIENFRISWKHRKALLAAEVNKRMEELLNGDWTDRDGNSNIEEGCSPPT